MTATTKPSYLRHTGSSKAKAVETDQGLHLTSLPDLDPDQSEMYQDGRLVRVEAPRIYEANFFKPTEAFNDRVLETTSASMPRGTRPGECYTKLDDNENLLLKTYPRKFVAAEPDPRRRQVDHRPSHRPRHHLLSRTQALVRTDLLVELARPRPVKLGRDELMSKFGEQGHVDKPMNDYNDLGGPSPGAHYVSTRAADERLKRVQTLAVDLLDETRAFKLRRLRDELCVHVNKSLEEIERLQSTSWDPANSFRAWNPHHQVMFSNVVSDSKNSEIKGRDKHPAFLKEAAWDWKFRKKGKIGRQDTEYFALVEKAKRYARVTRESARHSSSSGVLPSSPSQPEELLNAAEIEDLAAASTWMLVSASSR